MLLGRTFIRISGVLGVHRLPQCGRMRPWWLWKHGKKLNGDTMRKGCRWFRVGICMGRGGRISRRRDRSTLRVS